MNATRTVPTLLEAICAPAIQAFNLKKIMKPVLVSIGLADLINTPGNVYCLNLLPDIDECALNTSGCNQNCTNTIGSYLCSCYTGYQLEKDNETCIGKHWFS